MKRPRSRGRSAPLLLLFLALGLSGCALGGVHLMTTTGDGWMVLGRLKNSHHPVFRDVRPRTMNGARQVAIRSLLAARGKGAAEGGP